jgi:hypothetical protein
MRIVQAVRSRLPVAAYGGGERVVWWLSRELARRGHQVVLLAEAGTQCPFAEVRILDRRVRVEEQIPPQADIVHLHHPFSGMLARPYLITIQGNSREGQRFDRNTVFVSRDHARRHGSKTFVYNGIDPADYGEPELHNCREYFHFLGRAAWRVKNVRGAIQIARRAGARLRVLGGYRLNLNMGFRLTLDRNVSFAGMVGGERKNRLIGASRGLIFPVLWPEPFGLAVIESLYFGCPVIGTPYGALPELVPTHVGRLSDRLDELVEAVQQVEAYRRNECHEWVLEHFTVARMASDYLHLYQRVLSGESLNPEPPVAGPAGTCSLS